MASSEKVAIVSVQDGGDVFRPNWQLKCIFGVVGLLNFVAALDATSISVSLPASISSLQRFV
jgi:hypothetical protein